MTDAPPHHGPGSAPATGERVSDPVPWSLLPETAGLDVAGGLSVGGVGVEELAERFGTPLFVYDEEHLRRRCREAIRAFGPGGVTYAGKAFLCRAMARLVAEEGLRLDIASGGELAVALAAGTPAASCVLHGNNKLPGELARAVAVGVGRIVVDSAEEIRRLAALAAGRAEAVAVMVRVTPGVEAHTHTYVSTGQVDSKFGFPLAGGAAERAIREVMGIPGLRLVGLHCHIGSQLFRLDAYARALERMVPLVEGLLAEIPPSGSSSLEPFELSVGGGLGVAYVAGEEAPTLSEWAAFLRREAVAAGLPAGVRLTVEPGRAIVAAAALTVYRVGVVKQLPGVRTYVAVDGGMSDNPRPVLYGSGYEAFLVRAPQARRPLVARVVGRHCESGDVIVHEAHLPADLAVGDLLATPVTGAYGYSMASTYNRVPRPAVVFVRDGAARVVIRRETDADLLVLDVDDVAVPDPLAAS